jgi:hypothetical protein
VSEPFEMLVCVSEVPGSRVMRCDRIQCKIS